MGELQNFVRDDENDTLLFEKLQEHVLENYPNPDRIGCFDHSTLLAFVETPGKVDLEDQKYLHVFRCAECTRDLMELRRLREERIRKATPAAIPQPFPWWRTAGIAAAVLLFAVLIGFGWKYFVVRPDESAQNGPPVPVSVDLSSDGLSRGGDQDTGAAAISLPRRRVDLHLVLPYYSPAGTYRVTLTKNQSQGHVEASDAAPASVQGSHAELRVRLDLEHLSPGSYFLATAREGDGAPYYYPAIIRQ